MKHQDRWKLLEGEGQGEGERGGTGRGRDGQYSSGRIQRESEGGTVEDRRAPGCSLPYQADATSLGLGSLGVSSYRSAREPEVGLTCS